MAKYDLMDSAVYEKRIDICEQAINEVGPETGFPTFLEMKSLD